MKILILLTKCIFLYIVEHAQKMSLKLKIILLITLFSHTKNSNFYGWVSNILLDKVFLLLEEFTKL